MHNPFKLVIRKKKFSKGILKRILTWSDLKVVLGNLKISK